MISDDDWLRLLTNIGVRPLTAAKWNHPFADEVQVDKFSGGEQDFQDWLAEILYESAMLERVEECLSYTPERINQVWPSRFPTIASAIPYSHSPEKLGNYVYANRMGNGSEASGDGFLYRGRGPIQLTGRAAYAHTGDLVGQDLLGVPDLAAEPRFGLQISIHWWNDVIPDSMLSDQTQIRRRVNGGTLGLPQIVALHDKLLEIMA